MGAQMILQANVDSSVHRAEAILSFPLSRISVSVIFSEPINRSPKILNPKKGTLSNVSSTSFES